MKNAAVILRSLMTSRKRLPSMTSVNPAIGKSLTG
jgi:hypothetical protein